MNEILILTLLFSLILCKTGWAFEYNCYIGSTASALKVKMEKNRAKILFNDDGSANWNIPKEKQDSSRKYV
jgi:hypothetical protein